MRSVFSFAEEDAMDRLKAPEHRVDPTYTWDNDRDGTVYPIYKIPTRPTLKDLDACFLTYHSLHTPFQGADVTTESMFEVQPRESVEKTTLPIFGLASYKLRGSVWTSTKGSGHQLVNSLFKAADNWLRLRHVNHPDFIFFCR
ncbi:unnamed protein product [Eruca vesicaria subsp. sativa]|uniref:Uncharacterized protein n=1 Tax=Eruca vesicaria subsp. sativa TaxID=29727 RepID=A0ABC8LFP2_ERUVS|nr:unnamed protein product [Eruca vesicaria subsp. sativa]